MPSRFNRRKLKRATCPICNGNVTVIKLTPEGRKTKVDVFSAHVRFTFSGGAMNCAGTHMRVQK